ncbi:LAETG motif-containing sortase-dependent surface protein [Streptomyces sp. NPDC059161]|uniref:LAETG motif-containing sortase-dependent surface protein n=1 Tax=Streptomyces sp. NPDC059161 TaxID=3346749 RepID=UPI0036A411BA
MKLRRVWATTAVMTAIGTATLTAAPLASATTGDSITGASEAPSTAPHSTPSSSAASPKTGNDTVPDPGASSTPKAVTPSPSGSATDPKSPKKANEQPTRTPTTEVSKLPTPGLGECKQYPADEDSVRTSLRGLPNKIVAGSGWHEFTYRALNISDRTLERVNLDMELGTVDHRVSDISELLVTVEWFDTPSGKWRTTTERGKDLWGYFAGAKNIKASEYVEARMRIKVDGKAPAAAGFFFTSGYSMGEGDGRCSFGELVQWDFTIVPAGTKPTKDPNDAKGKPVKPGGPGTPQTRPVAQGDRTELPVSGRLAETGSSSTTLVVAAVGAAAVAAGSGALYIARRRKARTTA